MKTLDDYIDTARQIHGLKSDRQLCVRLKLSSPTVTGWRTKRQWPNDDSMVRLAELCEADPEEALLRLNTWRVSGPANAVYQKILRNVVTASIALFFAFSTHANAGTLPEHVGNFANSTVYYGKL